MAEKIIKTRIQNKHDFENNWNNATFTPKAGEIIIYEADINATGSAKGTHRLPRVKVGDGTTGISQLKFAGVVHEGAGDGSAIINEGNATGKYSFAAGSTDTSVIKDIVGIDASSVTDSIVNSALGTKGLRLKRLARTAASARGVSSVSFGTGADSITSMSSAFGVSSQAGSKGFMIKDVSLTSTNTVKISLMTTFEQSTFLGVPLGYSYKYDSTNKKLHIDCKSTSWSSANIMTNNNTSDTNLKWAVGDSVTIILGKPYCLCGKITSINSSSGVIEIDNQKGMITEDVLKDGAASVTDLIIVTPYMYTMSVPSKPEIGAKEIHFASIATGVGSVAAGTLSQAHGKMNLAAGQFSFAVGQDNETGYGAFASGEANRAIGYNSHAEGSDNDARGSSSHAEGSHTTAWGETAHAEGHSVINFNEGNVITDLTPKGVYKHWLEQDPTNKINKYSVAFGNYSHVEGQNSLALGGRSHAEGWMNTAFGTATHAEGRETLAIGTNSHTSGTHTVSHGTNSYVVGKYNKLDVKLVNGGWVTYERDANGDIVTDANGKNKEIATTDITQAISNNNYSFIVGNGSSDSSRSNAYTLDWKGKGTYYGGLHAAGDVTFGGNLTVSQEIYGNNVSCEYVSAGSAISCAGEISALDGVSTYGDVWAYNGNSDNYISLADTGELAKSNKSWINNHKISNNASALKANSTYFLGSYYNYSNGFLIDLGTSKQDVNVVLKITGHGYGAKDNFSQPVFSLFQFFNYWNNGSTNTSITRYSGRTFGQDVGKVTAYRYNSRLYIHVPLTSTYRTYSFELITNKTDLTPTVTNAGIPSSGCECKTEIIPEVVATQGFVTTKLADYALKSHTHSYASTSHTHDDRYYTESEVNNLLTKKADTGHTHSYNNLTDKPTIPPAYVLPKASSTTLGGIIVGNNLSIDSSTGKLSASYSVASTSSDGLMSSADKQKLSKIPTNLTVGSNTGAEVFNSSTNKATGIQSHAEGEKTTAAGIYSHAEGWRNIAYGEKSHAEGSTPCPYNEDPGDGNYSTTSIESISLDTLNNIWMNRDLDKKFNMAYGGWSHTECQGNVTFASRAHAEGWGCAARAVASHAEGVGTVTSKSSDVSRSACGQHVQGTYNAIDNNNEYLHIVGCGTSESDRKNAHTLDRDGNAWFRGNVYIGGTKESEGYRLPRIYRGTTAPTNSQGVDGDIYIMY